MKGKEMFVWSLEDVKLVFIIGVLILGLIVIELLDLIHKIKEKIKKKRNKK